jgi:hypothetical protein
MTQTTTADASAYLSTMISIFSKPGEAETVCTIVPALPDILVLLPTWNGLTLRLNWLKSTAGVRDTLSDMFPEDA